MADNFNMKQFLTENKLGPYSKLKEEETLNEYEVIYVWEGSRCYRITDEGYKDEVNPSYCQRYAEGKEEKGEKVEEIGRAHV